MKYDLGFLKYKKQLALPHRGTAVVIYTTPSHTQVEKPSTLLALQAQMLW